MLQLIGVHMSIAFLHVISNSLCGNIVFAAFIVCYSGLLCNCCYFQNIYGFYTDFFIDDRGGWFPLVHFFFSPTLIMDRVWFFNPVCYFDGGYYCL